MTYYGLAPGVRRKVRLAIAVQITIIFLGLLSGGLTGNRVLLVASGLISLVLTPFCIWLVRQLRRTRLGVGKDGLKLRGVMGSEELDFAWDAIERVHLDAQHQGLVLREPFDHPTMKSMVRAGQVRFSNASTESKIQADLVANQRWIPFESFSGWFEQGQLLAKFRQYAPRLAEDYDRVATEFSKTLKRRRIIFVVGCVLVIVVVLALMGVTVAILAAVPAGKSITLGTLLLILAMTTLNILILLLVPLLAYFAINNLIAAWREWTQKDSGAAMTCLVMAALQAGFAIWIASAILFGKRE